MSRTCGNCAYYGHFELPYKGSTGHCMLHPPKNELFTIEGKDVLLTRPLTAKDATCHQWIQGPVEKTEDGE